MIVFEKFGAKRISFDAYRREFELPYTMFYKKYIPNFKKEHGKVFFDAINSVETPEPFPQVKETLEFLLKKGIKMALLSSHPQKKIEKEIIDYGFSEFFVRVKGSVHDKIQRIYEITQQCEFGEKETAYVGDMTHDIEAGKKAKLITVAVSWGYQPKEKLLKTNPDFLIENLNQLNKIVF